MNQRDTTNETSTLWSVDAIEDMAFLQASNIEIFKHLSISRIGNAYDTTKVYVLYGCVNSGGGSVYSISAGAVLYNNEIFTVPAASFTAVNTAVANVVDSQLGNSRLFNDGVTRPVTRQRQLVITDAVSGTGISDFINFSPLRVNYSVYHSASVGIDSTYNAGKLLDTPFAFTTPNDGITRNYDIMFTCSAITLASATQEISLLIDGVQNGDGKSANTTGGTLENCISVSRFNVTVAPNKVIQIYAYRGTADSTCRFPSLSIREIK